MMKELITLYKECFPQKDAQTEIKALGENFEFDISGQSFVIYIVTEDEAEIIDIGTAPGARKKGSAEKLLLNLFNTLKNKNISKIFLEVAEDNIPAISLYKKCGFEEYNRRKAYYPQKNTTGDIVKNTRIDAILMRKPL